MAGAPASGDELHVRATPEISTKQIAPEHPTAAVPTFTEWQQLYPKMRLDAQKAYQFFKTLSAADKFKSTEGLLAHLNCDPWRLFDEAGLPRLSLFYMH